MPAADTVNQWKIININKEILVYKYHCGGYNFGILRHKIQRAKSSTNYNQLHTCQYRSTSKQIKCTQIGLLTRPRTQRVAFLANATATIFQARGIAMSFLSPRARTENKCRARVDRSDAGPLVSFRFSYEATDGCLSHLTSCSMRKQLVRVSYISSGRNRACTATLARTGRK